MPEISAIRESDTASADEVGHPNLLRSPKIRLFVSPCRSGSTALLRAFASHPDVTALYQPVKCGLRENGDPNYGFFFSASEATEFVIAKETLGPHTAAECLLDPFPTSNLINEVFPVFLIRHPLACFNGWNRQGWNDVRLLNLAYSNLYKLWLSASLAASASTAVLTYESLTLEPRKALEFICRHWGLSYHPSLLTWQPFKQNQRFVGGKDFERSLREGSFDAAVTTQTFEQIESPNSISVADMMCVSSSATMAIYNEMASHEQLL